MATKINQSNHYNETKSLNILGLPFDLLIRIIENFQYKQIDNYGRVNITETEKNVYECRRTIQNVRLVCRLFDQIASPYIYSVIKLPIEKCSLDFVNEILKRSAILDSIRIVEVVTSYCPEVFAQSLTSFKESRLHNLYEVHYACQDILLEDELSHANADFRRLSSDEFERVHEAVDNYDSIRFAWNEYVSPTLTENESNETKHDSEKVMKYQRILQQGHLEYRIKHEKQRQLFTDRSYQKAVVKLISRIPHRCFLSYIDTEFSMVNKYLKNPTAFLLDTEELFQFMSSPYDWSTIENFGGPSALAPSELFSTLPIAIYRQGIALQGVHTNCYPVMGGYYRFCVTTREAMWNNLYSSCQQITSFEFGRKGRSLGRTNVRLNHPQGDDEACLNRYFSAMLSSLDLEYIYLSLYSFMLQDERNNSTSADKNLCIDLSSALRKRKYPNVREATVKYISIRQDELDAFCDGLGSKLELLYLYNVELLNGTWASTVDILRKKVSTRGSGWQCRIYFKELYGSEFGHRQADQRSWSEIFSGHPPKLSEGQILVQQCLKYVNGDVGLTRNPLK